MRMTKTLARSQAFFGALVALLSLLSASTIDLRGQTINSGTEGNNAVWLNGSTIMGSSAFIDAAPFAGNSSTDFCVALNGALSMIPIGSAAVIDARGLNSTNTSMSCAKSPWAYPSTITLPSTVLLPPGTITISVTWVLPDRTKLFGAGRTQTNIQVAATSPPSPMIQMCPTGSTCTGVAISDLRLYGTGDATGNVVSGIYNAGSQEGSYVNHVSLAFIEGTALDIESGANNSGPYSDLEISAGGSSKCTSSNDYCGQTQNTTCVKLENVTTRGVHGFTCTADGGDGIHTTYYGPAAGIYVDGNNNTIEDGHFEGVNVGIAVGAKHSAAGNVVLNITGASGGGTSGTMRNVIYICNPADSYGGTVQACTHFSGGTVTDLVLSQIQDYTTGQLLLQDDQTDTTLTSTSAIQNAGVGMYFLGEPLVNGSTTIGYPRFSTFWLQSGTVYDESPLVPTWGVASLGSSAPSNPCPTGSIFSNRTGSAGSKDTIYVCVGGSWVGAY